MLAELDHYPLHKAANYHSRHAESWRARLTTWRERQALLKALKQAGYPRSVLDLPCGTGRFWPVFAETGVTELIAADNSSGMLEVAESSRMSPELPTSLMVSSAFSIALPDDRVDLVACLRFYHHLAAREDRVRLLRELKRVSRRYVVLSLWVDGNLGSVHRKRKRKRPAKPGYGPRTCQRREDAEREFREAGFEILAHQDVWPYLQMWRFYLLEIADPGRD